MNAEETKVAFENELPVIRKSLMYGEIAYKRIEQIIYSRKNGRTVVSCALLDFNGRSVTVAPMEEIHAAVKSVMCNRE